nr:MAG TPA: hypothetical protein [Bacteriophage sp.]
MNVNLSVKDRLSLITILPSSGTLLEMSEVFEIVKIIKFSDEEKKSIDYTENEGKIYWNLSKEEPREFELTFEQIKIIKKAVEKLDGEGKIDFSNYDICFKFSKL